MVPSSAPLLSAHSAALLLLEKPNVILNPSISKTPLITLASLEANQQSQANRRNVNVLNDHSPCVIAEHEAAKSGKQRQNPHMEVLPHADHPPLHHCL